MAQIRASMFAPTTPVTTPDGGVYVFDPADNSSADNTGLVLVTAGGQRLKRQVPDRRITPQMFGAIADGLTDCGAALQAWIDTVGYELFLPDGVYVCSRALTRTNRGAVSLTFGGKARILFNADTDGIAIVNPLNGNYGAVVLRDVRIVSTGPKTNRTGLLVTTQHEQRPGPLLDNVQVHGTISGQEWAKSINVFDCSGSRLMNPDILGATGTVTHGITIANTSGRPSVEHYLFNPAIRTVKRAVNIIGKGVPGVEGVKIFGGDLAGVFEGIFYVSENYLAPDFSIFGTHINSFGGEALHIEGVAQPTFGMPLVYANKSSDGTVPSRAVYVKNTFAAQGGLRILTMANIPDALFVDGTGAANTIHVAHITSAAGTNSVHVVDGFGESLRSDIQRQWDNNTTWGTTQGVRAIGPVINSASIPYSAYEAGDGAVMRIKNYQIEAVQPSSVFRGIVPVTGPLRLTSAHNGKMLVIVTNDNVPITVSSGLPAAFDIDIFQNNTTGITSFLTDGAWVNEKDNNTGINKLTGKYKRARLTAISENWYALTGDVSS